MRFDWPFQLVALKMTNVRHFSSAMDMGTSDGIRHKLVLAASQLYSITGAIVLHREEVPSSLGQRGGLLEV